MTIDQAQEIFDGWRTSPPAHHMMQVLAAAWGWKPPRDGASAPTGKPVSPPAMPGGNSATVTTAALRGILAGIAPTGGALRERNGR